MIVNGAFIELDAATYAFGIDDEAVAVIGAGVILVLGYCGLEGLHGDLSLSSWVALGRLLQIDLFD
mgnify:FL=1